MPSCCIGGIWQNPGRPGKTSPGRSGRGRDCQVNGGGAERHRGLPELRAARVLGQGGGIWN